MYQFYRLLVLLCTLLILNGCLSIGTDSKPVTLFRLNPVLIDSTQADTPILKLNVSSGSLLNSQRLWVFQTDGRVAAFSGARWAMTLPELYKQTLTNALEQSGSAVVVESPAESSNLHIAIRDFQIEQMASGSVAVVGINATWSSIDGERQHRLIRSTISASLESAQNVANAMNKANEDVLQQLQEWIIGKATSV